VDQKRLHLLLPSSLVGMLLPVSLASAQQTVKISAPHVAGAAENHSSNPRINADGSCVVFQSNGELDACFGVNRSDTVFVHDTASAKSTLASLIEGSKQGFGTDKAAVSGDCSVIAFNIYEVVGAPPVPTQVYWREFPGSTLDEGTTVLPVDTPQCQSIDVAATLDYEIRQPGKIVLNADPNAIDLQVHSADQAQAVAANVDCELSEDTADSVECLITQLALTTGPLVLTLTSLSQQTEPFTLTLDGETDEGYASVINGIKSDGYIRGFSIDLSNDGRKVVFGTTADNLSERDNNGFDDIYIHDTVTAETQLISSTNDGNSGNNISAFARISGDGSKVLFSSSATDLLTEPGRDQRSAFLHDVNDATTQLVSVNSEGEPANRPVIFVDISADGNHVVFETASNNLVDLDQNGVFDDLGDIIHQIYIHNVNTGETELVSVDNDGVPGDSQHLRPVVSGNGRYVAFLTSSALVSEDINETVDVYVRDRVAARTALVSKGADGSIANEYSHSLDISDDGQWLTFESSASNLTADDDNDVRDIFLVNLFSMPELAADTPVNDDGPDQNNSSNSASAGGGGCSIAAGNSGSTNIFLLLLLVSTLALKILRDSSANAQA